MLFISTVVLFACSLDLGDASPFVVPLRYSDVSNVPQVIVSVAYQADISGKPFYLTMADQSLIEAAPRREHNGFISRGYVQFPETMNERPLAYIDPRIVVHQAGAGWYLGVGPESELVRLHDSISIIRRFDEETFERRDEMVVGLGLDAFVDLCKSPLMRIENIHHADFPGTATTPAMITFRTVTSAHGGAEDEYTPSHISLQGYEKVRFSRYFADRIGLYIRELGGVETPHPLTFSECDWDSAAKLPFVRIDLRDVTGNSVSVNFIPDDYMRIDEISRTCTVLAFSDDRDMLAINPLLFPEMNVRITKSRIGFCKSV